MQYKLYSWYLLNSFNNLQLPSEREMIQPANIIIYHLDYSRYLLFKMIAVTMTMLQTVYFAGFGFNILLLTMFCFELSCIKSIFACLIWICNFQVYKDSGILGILTSCIMWMICNFLIRSTTNGSFGPKIWEHLILLKYRTKV